MLTVTDADADLDASPVIVPDKVVEFVTVEDPDADSEGKCDSVSEIDGDKEYDLSADEVREGDNDAVGSKDNERVGDSETVFLAERFVSVG